MYPRTNYEMTEADLEKLLEACKPTPAIWGSGGAPMFATPQENANRAWAELGKRMGFDSDTVQPMEGKSAMFFTAIPTENEVQRAERIAREDLEAKRARVEKLTAEVEDAKRRLSEALA